MFIVPTVPFATVVKLAAMPLVGPTGVVRTPTPSVAPMANTAVPTDTLVCTTRATASTTLMAAA